jgi:GNAT superfamily N-acetyltransferase
MVATGVAIELIESPDPAAYARIASAVMRWIPISAAEVEHRRSVMTRRDWLGLLDGEPVGVAACGVVPGRETSTAAASSFAVLPAVRHRGVGGALYREVSAAARAFGRAELEAFAFDDDPDAAGFAAGHGFTAVARVRALRLPLAGCARPAVAPPDGVAITTVAETAGLEPGIWEVASESWPDIPYDGDVPLQPPPLEQFTDVYLGGPGFIPEATFAAVREREVLGYGMLQWLSRADGIALHEMLAVRRAWRGRGIARALKAAQIAWAIDTGLTELRTANEERNVPARAVNAHFPYVPMPDGIVWRGPALP